MSPGDRAVVVFDVLDGQSFDGEIHFVGATVEPRSRTFPIEITLPNPVGLIKPEMVTNIAVVRRELTDVVVVPRDALVRVEDGFIAFVVISTDQGSVAEARSVRLGPAQRNLVVIEEGLEVGERLVVVGQRQLANGDRINIVEQG